MHRIIDDDAAADRLSKAVSSDQERQVASQVPPGSRAPAFGEAAGAAAAGAGTPPSALLDIVEPASIFTGADSAAAHPDAWVPTSLATTPGIAARHPPQGFAAADKDAKAQAASGDGPKAPAGTPGSAPSAAHNAPLPTTGTVVGGRLIKARPLNLKRVVLVGKSTRLDRVGSQALNVGAPLCLAPTAGLLFPFHSPFATRRARLAPLLPL